MSRPAVFDPKNEFLFSLKHELHLYYFSTTTGQPTRLSRGKIYIKREWEKQRLLVLPEASDAQAGEIQADRFADPGAGVQIVATAASGAIPPVGCIGALASGLVPRA